MRDEIKTTGPARPRGHVPGDVLRTKIGELYTYLGYYEGSPRSIYDRPDAGYLYMFYSSTQDGLLASAILGDALWRARFGDIDGNACYTRHPKKFEAIETHVDLAPVMDLLQRVFGLARVGDHAPRKRPAGSEATETENKTPGRRPLVAVLGGSFNPPTKAHLAIATHVMRHAWTDECILVPSSGHYVTRKATRNRTPRIYTETERLEMLLAMTKSVPGVTVDTCEFGDQSSGRTYATMLELQNKRPDARLRLIVGADKLHVIPRWRNAEGLLRNFGLIVLPRADDDAEAMIAADPFLAKNKNRITLVPALDNHDGVSSSACQRLMYAAGVDAARHMLHPAVAAYLERLEEDT